MIAPRLLFLGLSLPFLVALGACGPGEEWTEKQDAGNRAYQTGDFGAAEANFQAALVEAEGAWSQYPFVAISLDSLALARTAS